MSVSKRGRRITILQYGMIPGVRRSYAIIVMRLMSDSPCRTPSLQTRKMVQRDCRDEESFHSLFYRWTELSRSEVSFSDLPLSYDARVS